MAFEIILILMTDDKTIILTGGIGSGKSVIARILRCNGFKVFDCDSQAKTLMQKDPELRETLSHKLGKDIFLDNGSINKPYLASLLFADDKVRRFVNKVVHKAVRKRILDLRENIKGLFFVETAIPDTGGLLALCDQVWMVSASLDERIKRIGLRDGFNDSEILKRINTQKKEYDNIPKDITIVIDNDRNNKVLSNVLKMTEKSNNLKTYIISC